MLTATQRDARMTGFGGSDCAAVCGLSRWRSPLNVYLEKRGEIPPFEGNEYTRWGQALEPAIRQAYSDETGRVVRLPEDTIRHHAIPFLLCHPDGVTDDNRLFEAKNTRSGEGWGEPGTDEIPREYLLQVQHNMLVMGLAVADVAVLIAGSDFRLYEVPADPELHEILIAREAALWERIEKGIPPAPTTALDVRLLYGRSSVAKQAVADEGILGVCGVLAALKAKAAVIESEIEQAETAIKAAMKDADTLIDVSGTTLATWRVTKPRETFDVARFRSDHPEIHAAYTRAGEVSRRFLLKG